MALPASAPAVWEYVRRFFGVSLPYKAFTPGHSTPLAFVTEALLHPGRDLAAWSCRSGGKTLAGSIIAAVEFAACPGLQARVLSGSEDQAGNLYAYWRRWCGRFMPDLVSGRITRHLSAVNGGRLEILAASQKRVRGPKVHRLFEDELDEIDPAIDEAAAGMLASADGIPAATRYTSTWHRVDGPMARLVASGPASGVTLHKWNVWEAIARCERDRHDDGRGCESCPLAPACVAKARQVHGDEDRRLGIAAEACGLYDVADAIKAYRKVGSATWAAEYECRRPSAAGLVYQEFDETVHRLDRPPGEITVYRAIDWGFNVFACLWLGETPDGRVVLLDTYKAERTALATHAAAIKARKVGPVAATYCDPAGRNANDQTGRSNVQQFHRMGIPCTWTLARRAREVANGIALVRAALSPAAGPPRFGYLPNDNNGAFVRDMLSYRNRRVNGMIVDEPVDPQPAEHTMDALRYFFVNRHAGREIRRVDLRTG